MDLLNMTNKPKIHELYKKFKYRKFLSLTPEFTTLLVT